MTIEEIRDLIHIVNESGIAELEVTRGGNSVRIRRSEAPAATQGIVLSAAPAAPALSLAPSAAVSAAAPLPPVVTAPAPIENTVYVKSPIVGTYYESASPGTPAFVKVGDRVSAGQVLCIIESMKLMNEIESEVSGTVVSKLVESGRPVEYGESLFAIQPA